MIRIVECDQGSDEWRKARLGIPTASMFATIMAKGKDGGASKTRKEYMRKLAGEIITGEPMDGFSNVHTERGKMMEDEARRFYAFLRDVEPQLIGFVRNGQMGCSPDSFISANGGLEIKTKLPHLQIACLEANKLPPEHKAQVHGNIWVAEKEWFDFISYWPKMPPLIVRTYRDDEYIKAMSEAVDRFNDELAELVELIRSRFGNDLKAQLEQSVKEAA